MHSTHLTRDGRLLFLARFIRLLAYGAVSVVVVLYLTKLGLRESQTGMLLTVTLVGDTIVSLVLKLKPTASAGGRCCSSTQFGNSGFEVVTRTCGGTGGVRIQA